MANYGTLKAAIQSVIKTNGNNEITGALLQQSLIAAIESLGVGYQYMGTAIPTTNPGTPDQNVFYVAIIPGIYANFNSLVLQPNEIGIFRWKGSWALDKIRSRPVLTGNFEPSICELYVSTYVEGMKIHNLTWNGTTVSFTIRINGSSSLFISNQAANPYVPILIQSSAASPVQYFAILTLTDITCTYSSTGGVPLQPTCGNLFMKPYTTKKLIDLAETNIASSENSAVIRSQDICVSRFNRGALNPNGLYNNSYIALSRRFTTEYDSVLFFGNKDAAAITNKYFDFRNFALLTKGDSLINYPKTVVDIVSQVFNSPTTDCILPLTVAAVNNVDGDNSEQWATGQNHAYGNVGNGVSRTMRELSCDVQVDGVNVPIGTLGVYGKKCIIKVVNRVQGYNTCKRDGSGREIIEQTITIEFDKNNCIVTVDYVALEPVIIYKILGVGQYAAENTQHYYRFIGSTSKLARYEFNSVAQTPTSEDNKINSLQCLYGGYALNIKVEDYGIGNLSYNRTLSNALFSSANKIYSRLMDEVTPITLDTNGKVSYRFRYDIDYNVN